MTPGARYAAAIEILDRYLDGEPAEKTLTNWARNNRFAGSGDRAAIRDLVFTALRNKLSFAALGGGMTGRALMIGQLRSGDMEPSAIFNGEGYAPPSLTEEEQTCLPPQMDQASALDCPDWLVAELQRSLGKRFVDVMTCLKSRAPVFLRVNLKRISREEAARQLLSLDIATVQSELSPSALQVTTNERRVANSTLYKDGLVEVQDAGSQWLADNVPVSRGGRVLDFCAGGGGKSLAMAARVDALYYAHDRYDQRMSDLPVRAKRAGAKIEVLASDALKHQAAFDTVLCDVPCSGSGAWRRSPEGKWSFNQQKLDDTLLVQSEILDQAAGMVGAKGTLAYATCSLMNCENEDQITRFVERFPVWECYFQRALTPLDGGDGFFLALLKRRNGPGD